MSIIVVSSRSLATAAIVIVIVMVIIGAIPFPNSLPNPNSWRWIGIAGLMIFFLAIIGKAINDRWTGILIDERKVMTLSRLQIIIWTVIIVSAYFTIASVRIHATEPSVPDPLGIAIDWRLWALLGISSTSLVGTPLILDSKKKKTIDERKEARKLQTIATRSKIEVGSVKSSNPEDKELIEVTKDNVKGIIFVNKETKEAEFSDIFTGDEVGNRDHVDMSKVQMFFFTMISALAYVVMLFTLLDGTTPPEDLDSLPTLPDGLIALLTISHGAYLTYKTVDHTSTK